MEIDSKAIETAQELYNDDEIPNQLAFIKANFQILAKSITSLEERLPLAASMKILKQVEDNLNIEPFAGKLYEVLMKNPDFQVLMNISKVLSGESVPKTEQEKLPTDPAVLSNFSCAPITSVDVERCFSSLKDLLSFKRLRLTESHVRDQIMLQWNKDVLKETL